MSLGKIFAWSVIVLQAGASIGYFSARDYKHGFYWLWAVAISVTVTLW